jgi:serine/threonine protein kinase
MLNPGAELQNRYKIERQVGAGGMGTVYIATDLRFGTKVAIKETHFAEANMRRAFEREAQLLNGLRHPALPRVSDHFCEDDGQFIVMEYIAGDDLSEVVEGGFAVADVLRWADTLLDALDYLHTQKMPILHRDIKPQNLKLTERGEVILLDFGLAKGSVSEQTQASMAKSVFGYSLSYAPLEQIKGVGTDPRTDIYSLAATIYHLLTGQPPVDSITRATTILNGNADPLQYAHELNDKIPVSVSEALRKAMELNPHLRPATAAQVRRELLEAASQPVHSEKSLDTFASEKTIVNDYGLLKTNVVNVPANNLSKPLKTDAANAQATNQHKTGTGNNIYHTDYTTKNRNPGKSFGSQTALHRSTTARKSSNTGILSQLQNSRAVQVGALLTVLLLGVSAWYSMITTNDSSNAIPQKNQNSERKTDSELLTTSAADTQPTFTETNTGNNTPVYAATPSAFNQEAPLSSAAGTSQNQSPRVAVSQSQTISSPQETTTAASANDTTVREAKTEEFSRSQQEVRTNNSGNQIDEEKMKAEMKKQVDEAIRQREEAMRQQESEQQPQGPPYRQPPPPDGRRFPPPPGHRPPPPRRP